MVTVQGVDGVPERKKGARGLAEPDCGGQGAACPRLGAGDRESAEASWNDERGGAAQREERRPSGVGRSETIDEPARGGSDRWPSEEASMLALRHAATY